MNITLEYKNKVIVELLEVRKYFTGSDAQFAKQWSMNSAVYSQLKNGYKDGLLKDTQWLIMGRELGVTMQERKWKVARTEVYRRLEEEIDFCQTYSKSKMLVDWCDIGKSFSARHIARTRKNCFYLDASQSKTKQAFIRAFAKVLGIDYGRYIDMKANIKYYLQTIEKPIVIIDEAGDLEYTAFLELKEFWNATENTCGWYMIGADGLREKIRRGIESKKVGYRELFSRFSGKYTVTVPQSTQDRLSFYRKMVTDVLSVNMDEKEKRYMTELVNRCIVTDENGNIGGLRRAESLLILMNNIHESNES